MNLAVPSAGIPSGRALQELRFALAEADASPPPATLRDRVLGGAEAMRSPGLPVFAPAVITPLEGYRRTVSSLDALLVDLRDEEWARPVLRELTVQGLVGHLIGVERAFQAVVGIDDTEASGASGSDHRLRAAHIVDTQADADAERHRAPGDTRRRWRARCERTLDQLASWDPARLEVATTLHGVTLEIDRMMIVRAFEMWTHEEDIRRATARPLLAPDPARLALMTDLAVAALPRGLEILGRPHPRRTARVVLTGPGGGTFVTALGRDTPGSPDVRIVADATSFCRLVADRLDPGERSRIVVSGDEMLGLDVLSGARALALD